jgi:DNA-binding NarL/FixJ family response regulator
MAGTDVTEPITVVLVEDHEGVRERLTHFLAGAGVCVLDAVATVRQAYDSITQLRPHVAVVDNHLPDGRGVDLCRRLSGIAPGIALLIYSGTLRPAEEREALAAGARAAILKSMNTQPLLDAIKSCRADQARVDMGAFEIAFAGPGATGPIRQWAVRWPNGGVTVVADEDSALLVARGQPGVRVVSRWVGGWSQ